MRKERLDGCIIGSGAGGAVLAYEAARRELTTLVLKRGPYVWASDMSSFESEMIPRLYNDAGMQLNTSLDFYFCKDRALEDRPSFPIWF